MYTENEAPRYWQWWLLLLFLLLLLPNIWLPELLHDEGSYGLMAQEMRGRFGSILLPRLMGQRTVIPPLPAWLLTLISFALPLNEFSIRLIGVLPLGLLALVCGWLVRRRVGVAAGAATAVAVMASFAALQQGTRGDGSMLFALLINMAWLSWYVLSRERRRWFYAWAAAHFFVCLAILVGGLTAVFYFYFPLLFLQRPLTVGRRLVKPDHWVSLLLATGLVFAWILMIPDLKGEFLDFLRRFQPEQAAMGYLQHLVTYPLRVLLGTLPLAFLLWPSFCAAYRPLEHEPVFCQYLRTIIISLFVCFWLLPNAKAVDLLPVIGPMGILVGTNYDLLVRRHGRQLQLLPEVFGAAAFVGAVPALVVGAFLWGRVQWLDLPWGLALGAGLGLMGAALGGWWIRTARSRLPVWLSLLVGVVVFHLLWTGTVNTWKYTMDSPRRDVAEVLGVQLPPGVTVFNILPPDMIIPAECFYLHRPIRRLAGTGELPVDLPVVYVLAEDRVPVIRPEMPSVNDSTGETGANSLPPRAVSQLRLRERTWTAASQPVPYGGRTLRMWRGRRRFQRATAVNGQEEDSG